jgi:hypothetical protein
MLEREKQPPHVVKLRGYLAPSTKPGFHRVYFGLNLRTYVDFPESSLLHHAPIDPANPMGPMRILVAGPEQLEVVQVLDTAFLMGAIASAHPLASADQPKAKTMTEAPLGGTNTWAHFDCEGYFTGPTCTTAHD